MLINPPKANKMLKEIILVPFVVELISAPTGYKQESHPMCVAAFTGNPVNYAILFIRVDSVFWSYQLRP